MWINEQEYSFPDTRFYFTPQESYDKGVSLYQIGYNPAMKLWLKKKIVQLVVRV